ncbi:sensor histidine kinase [Atopobium fossor]|uniref:sensor histidine kinase n=1 Tax=Atopobium fossor TaxID=39487 RepID=UPI0003FDB3FC|nr:HAMP domain-containing sensor histidine kinase [Atopobium fossor]
MKRNNHQNLNTHAGAMWVWLMCIMAGTGLFLLVPLLHAFFAPAAYGAYYFPRAYYIISFVDCVAMAGMLFIAKQREMANDIKIAWLFLWRWMLGYCVLAVLVLICTYTGLALTLLVLTVCSLSFVILAERQACLTQIQKTVRNLAAGDLTAQVDDCMMQGSLRELAHDVNKLAQVISKAADERAEALRKSLDAEQKKVHAERLRNELIANVSHDLKTPLTSVISYTDLLSHELVSAPEDREEQKLIEYSDALTRQSLRLKKLIEDLIEASKAQTGNILVTLTPLNAGVLISQASGEWKARLSEKGIELVCKIPDSPLMIDADGKQMGRVIDNILSNVAKYGMTGTRAYVSAFENEAGDIEISCKNISTTPLHGNADELLERFVRGDASRTTEGSGLGLSIAQSLVELQGGALKLGVDADLFSVALYFPQSSSANTYSTSDKDV